MRGFLDAILSFILCSTLSDDEWATIDTLTDLSFTLDNYLALATILITRDSVSGAQDRLKFYFMAAGVQIPGVQAPVTGPSIGKSDIYLGDAL